MTTSLIIIFITLLFSAFFSGMEIAFVSVNRLKVELDREQGSFAARLVSKLLDRKKVFISAMLIGNNIAIVIYGIYAGDLITDLIVNKSSFLIESRVSSLLLKTFISAIIVLVTAEFLPKAFFGLKPNT